MSQPYNQYNGPQDPQSPPAGYPQQQGYGQPGYGQQQYGGYQAPYQQQPQGGQPPTHMVWSIISIFLFWPLAIVAIIKASQVSSLWSMGQYQASQDASRLARTMCLIATIIGVVVWVIVVIYIIVAAAALTTISNLPH